MTDSTLHLQKAYVQPKNLKIKKNCYVSSVVLIYAVASVDFSKPLVELVTSWHKQLSRNWISSRTGKPRREHKRFQGKII